jgi:hypothetical protein
LKDDAEIRAAGVAKLPTVQHLPELVAELPAVDLAPPPTADLDSLFGKHSGKIESR